MSYGVKYDSAGENAQVPTDGGTYAINGQTNIVVGSAPTNYKGDKIFLGWKLGEDVYMPGDVVALSKAAAGAENGTITFIAQWGDSLPQGEKIPLTINVYLQNSNDGYALSNTVGASGFVGTQVSVLNPEQYVPDGCENCYKLNGDTSNTTLTPGNESGTEFNLYFDRVMKDVSYSVEYYKDGVKVESDSYTKTQPVWVHDNTDSIAIQEEIDASGNKYEGYSLYRTAPEELPSVGTSVKSGSVYKVYYVANSYGVTYKFVSGTDEALPSEGMPAAPEKATVKYGEAVELPSGYEDVTDARGTWEFQGWRVEGTEEILDSYEMPANNVTLEGVWVLNAESVKSYGVTYKFVSGTDEALPSEGMPAAPEKATVKYGEAVELPSGYEDVTDARGTWEFQGWRVEGTEEILDSYEMPANNVTLEGVWVLNAESVKSYTVSYGWSGDVPSQIEDAPSGFVAKYGTNRTVATEPYEAGDTVTDERGVWTFNGWTTGDVAVANGQFRMPANDVVFTGTWTLTTVDISGPNVTVNAPEDVDYNGTDQTWEPVVTDGEKALVAGTDYEVSYSTDDHTNVTGTIKVTITGKGNYTGSVERYYQITPLTITVTPRDIRKTQGQADPTLTSDYSGYLRGETAGWTGALTREPGEAVGTYTISKGSLQLADNPDGNFLAQNYVLVVNEGTFTIVAAPVTPGGGDTSTPTPGGGTPTPGTPATVTPADDTTTDEAIEDDDTALAAPTDTIGDDDTPLAAGAKDEDCWVHWLILLGMILSAVYFVGVGVRRRKFTSSLLGYEDKVLGNDRDNA